MGKLPEWAEDLDPEDIEMIQGATDKGQVYTEDDQDPSDN